MALIALSVVLLAAVTDVVAAPSAAPSQGVVSPAPAAAAGDSSIEAAVPRSTPPAIPLPPASPLQDGRAESGDSPSPRPAPPARGQESAPRPLAPPGDPNARAAPSTYAVPPPGAPLPANAALGRGLVLSAEGVIPLVSYLSRDEPDPNVYPSEDDGGLSFGASHAFDRTPFQLPRLAIDGAIGKGFTIGMWGALGLVSRTIDDNHQGAVVVGLLGRVGYVVRIGDSFALWPRAGFGGFVPSNSRPTVTFVEASVPLVYFPVSHLGLTVGPTVDLTVTNDGGDTTVDARTNRIGLDAGMLLAF